MALAWGYTLPETNIAPENRPLEKEIPRLLLETTIFRGYVSFRECNTYKWSYKPTFLSGLGPTL